MTVFRVHEYCAAKMWRKGRDLSVGRGKVREERGGNGKTGKTEDDGKTEERRNQRTAKPEKRENGEIEPNNGNGEED
jgi:hypothetical protein